MPGVIEWKEYQDLTVVITGAASGMGRAVCQLLAAAGAKVHAVDIAPATVGDTIAYCCDMTSQSAVDSLVDALPPRIDAAFLCAGLSPSAPLEKVFIVNYFANRRLIDLLARRMSQGGAIAAVASLATGWTESLPLLADGLDIDDFGTASAWTATLREHAWDNGYMLSKHALIAHSLRTAPDLARRGIRLNTLCPGKTETPMMDQFRATVAEGLDAVPVPIGRLSTPEEQAHALLFLNSPRASYLVGALLANDGGSDAELTAGAVFTV